MPNQQSVDSDIVTAIFNEGTSGAISIDNFTSYSLESDFFVPADSFQFTIADDRADQLNNKIQIGSPITIRVNNAPQLIGYVDKIDYSYSRNAGTILKIEGRDALGLMSDSIVPPDLGFSSNTTIKDILTNLFDIFDLIIDENSLNDSVKLSAASAGLVGTASRSKTPTAIAKSWLRQINHQIKPRKEEGYLAYAIRISKELGLHIKLIPGTNTVYVNTPVYDRYNLIPFILSNKGSEDIFEIALPGYTNYNFQNNIINGKLDINWRDQPSIIIAEISAAQQPDYRIDSMKSIYVNELVGYDEDGLTYDFIHDTLKNLSKGKGYREIPKNSDLFYALPNLLLNQPKTISTISRPMFLFDEHGSNQEELDFFVLCKMAEKQNKFFTLQYEVKDHSQNLGEQKAIWNTNQMVTLNDVKLGITNNYWLQKRVFTKSRSGGTKTELTLKLPYIYNYYVTN